MNRLENPLVDVAWLAERLDHPDVVVADCRFRLDEEGRPPRGTEHIPGAVFFDLETDLSDPPGSAGGRHPLPDLQRLAQKVSAAGIDENTTVVCYDAHRGASAARLWWLLRYMGIPNVALLDGGYPAWVIRGMPVSSAIATPEPKRFVPDVQRHMLASLDDVRSLVEQGTGARLVDARASERYRGETEPLDPVAGHIPGAQNAPWMQTVTEDGFFKDADTLREQFAPLGNPEDLVVYCGSGVTACVVLLAMEVAGQRGSRLYAGGWSEWCRVPQHPIARGEEPTGGEKPAG